MNGRSSLVESIGQYITSDAMETIGVYAVILFGIVLSVVGVCLVGSFLLRYACRRVQKSEITYGKAFRTLLLAAMANVVLVGLVGAPVLGALRVGFGPRTVIAVMLPLMCFVTASVVWVRLQMPFRRACVIALILHAGAVVCGQTASLTWRTWNALDARAHELTPEHTPPQIAIIYVDQPSLDRAKTKYDISWPWPREVYGPAVSFCKRGGAKAVAFDIVFSEESPHGGEDDAALADAIRGGPPCVLGFASAPLVTRVATNGTPVGDAREWSQISRASSNSHVECLSVLRQNALFIGDTRVTSDQDGICRGCPLLVCLNKGVYPSLGFASYLAGKQPAELSRTRIDKEQGVLVVGHRRFPVDDMSRVTLKWRRAESYPTYSAISIIESELSIKDASGQPIIDPAVVKDKYVFIGLSAPGFRNHHRTLREKDTTSTLIHARLLDNLLCADSQEPKDAAAKSED